MYNNYYKYNCYDHNNTMYVRSSIIQFLFGFSLVLLFPLRPPVPLPPRL